MVSSVHRYEMNHDAVENEEAVQNSTHTQLHSRGIPPSIIPISDNELDGDGLVN